MNPPIPIPADRAPLDRGVQPLEVAGAVVQVREIARKDYDYLVFAAVDDPDALYVMLLLGSIALYTAVRRASPADVAALRAGADLDRWVDGLR